MADITEDDVTTALGAVIDPSQGKSVVELGMVGPIHIKQSNISFALEVPAHRGPAMEPVRKAAETAVRAIPGVTSATVVVTAHSGPATTSASASGGDDSDDAVVERVHEIKVRRFVAVASGKGGVQLMSMGLLVPDDVAMIWRGPMVQSALTQMLDSVAWGTLDVIVIDLPPGTGDIQISLAQQVSLAGAVVVSTPQDIALLDVVKAITMFDKAEVPVLGMVQNMAYWACPDCGRTDHIFGDGGAAAEAERRGIELLGEIPLSLEVRTGGDSGTPVVVASPRSEQAKTYRCIARRLMEVADLRKADEEEEES